MNGNGTQAMAIGNCGTCKFWTKAVEGKAGWKMGMGQCTNVPKYYDVGQDTDSDDPVDWGEYSYVLKPEFVDVKAVALDGSGYCAELLTTADFGCSSFASCGNAAGKTVVKHNGECVLFDRSKIHETVVELTQNEREMGEMGARHLFPASQEQIESITDAVVTRVSRNPAERIESERIHELLELAIMRVAAGLEALPDYSARAGHD